VKAEIETVMPRLPDGGRILGFSEASSGVSLEKKVDSKRPVLEQKMKWSKVFTELLNRELGM
jgi:hypothetical protein